MSEEVAGCLEAGCREAFERAKGREESWKMGWGLEQSDGARRVGIRR